MRNIPLFQHFDNGASLLCYDLDLEYLNFWICFIYCYIK